MFKVQSSGCGQLCYCSSGPLNFQSFYYKTCTIARFFCFCPLKKNYPADCLQQRTQPIGRESSVTVSADCIQFLCPLHDFFQKANQPSISWDALTALLPHSVALRKAQCCSALTVMIQSSAAPSSALLLLQVYHYRLTRDCIHMAVGMLLHTSYNKVPTFSLNSFLCLPCPKKYFVRHRCLS